MAASSSKGREPAQRARGRQPTFDRNEALETALELFWRHGYEGVSISDLTTAIGIAPPSLYHAFGSKAELYREVLRRYGSNGIRPEALADAPSSHEAVRQVLERGIAAVTTPGRPLGCMVSSGMLMTSAENVELAAELRALRASFREALERRIARDVKEGVLPGTTDAAALARFYVTVLQGLSVQAIDGATAAQLTAVMEAALDVWPVPPPASRSRDVSRRRK